MILWNSFLFVPDRKSTYRGILLMYPIYFNVASGRHCFPQNCFSLDIRHGCAAHVASITIPYSKQFKSFLWYFVWISIQLRLPAMWSAVSNAITFGCGCGFWLSSVLYIKHDFIVLGLGWVHWECVISRQFSGQIIHSSPSVNECFHNFKDIISKGRQEEEGFCFCRWCGFLCLHQAVTSSSHWGCL